MKLNDTNLMLTELKNAIENTVITPEDKINQAGNILAQIGYINE